MKIYIQTLMGTLTMSVFLFGLLSLTLMGTANAEVNDVTNCDSLPNNEVWGTLNSRLFVPPGTDCFIKPGAVVNGNIKMGDGTSPGGFFELRVEAGSIVNGRILNMGATEAIGFYCQLVRVWGTVNGNIRVVAADVCSGVDFLSGARVYGNIKSDHRTGFFADFLFPEAPETALKIIVDGNVISNGSSPCCGAPVGVLIAHPTIINGFVKLRAPGTTVIVEGDLEDDATIIGDILCRADNTGTNIPSDSVLGHIANCLEL